MDRRLALSLTLVAAAGLPWALPAAESYDACRQFIDSVPAVIDSQGTWCLRRDLSTALASGSAITVATNNVTIDCNGFKIGGLAAGEASQASGIFAKGRQNLTVRNCNIRGFNKGIDVTYDLAPGDSAGHLVEDNQLDNNLAYGITVFGENNMVRRNRVFDTGGAQGSAKSYGILAFADIEDNTVKGVFATAANSGSVGIHAGSAGALVRGNVVSGVQVSGSGIAFGIYGGAHNIRISGNHVVADETVGYGIDGFGSASSFCDGNTVAGFATPFSRCQDAGGNATH